MDALLSQVLKAHGGLERWSELSKITAQLSIGGPIWAAKGWPGALAQETVEIDLAQERSVFGRPSPLIIPSRSSSRHHEFGGIVFPPRRRVFRRNPDGTSNLNLPSITIDVKSVTVE